MKTGDAIVAMGGNLWEKYGKKRVYIPETMMHKLYGLEYTTYGTGNISSASVNGESISNTQAKKLMGGMLGKMWFDYADGELHFQNMNIEIANVIEKRIMK